jgi:cytosine/adenosine deaminase-related metal-dependent hydrolase
MEPRSDIAGGTESSVRTRHLLQQTNSSAISHDATLRFANGLIQDVAFSGEQARFPNTLIVPALANAHDHGRGLKASAYGAFDTAVEAWVPATYTLPRLDPYVIAALAFARMARAGITSVVHCHLSTDQTSLIAAAEDVARAARDVGVRVAFVVPLRDRNRLGYGEDEAILAHMEPADIDAIASRWLRPIPAISTQLDMVETIAGVCENPRFTVQHGPVGMEWCSDALLTEVATAAAASDRRVHMHLLESRYQRGWADREYSEGPVARLAKLGLLSPRLTLAHGVWLRPEENQLLAGHGVTVSVNTSSNLRLKSGIAQLAAMKAAGVPFAIGLDSLALDDDDDILRELRLAYLLHAGLGFDAEITREDILHAGSTTGACTVCGERQFGQLAKGAPADFIVLDYAKLAADIPTNLDDPFRTFFARARTGHIASVFAAGKQIVRDGRVLGIDEDALRQELSRQLESASAAIVALKPLMERYQQGLAQFYRASDHSSWT